jgi:glutamate-1-semialdehyde 2,1-aminomutase
MGRNSLLFSEAQKYIPGGVNSPVRAFRAVGGTPPFISRANGCSITDEEGREYVDCLMSWGPLILGHAHPEVLDAINRAVANRTSFGAPTEAEITLAQRVVSTVPGIEKVRFVNSGTEATMSAVRLARGVTGRDKIIKCAGCYHGHADYFLIKSGSGALTHGVPNSPGVTKNSTADTLIAEYNDIASVEQLFDEYPEEIACVIVEPVAGNMGVVLPDPVFLKKLRTITQMNHALLIFDEVITGFRLSIGGAQQYFDIIPDLTTLGKIIGGGMPVGAFGGSAEIMDNLAPEGPVYQAGTLSGNPIAMAAGNAVLEILSEEKPYQNLSDLGEQLFSGLQEIANEVGIDLTVNHIGSFGTLFFTNRPVRSFSDVMASDSQKFAQFHSLMLQRGIYLAPSAFESIFLSTAHNRETIDRIHQAARESFIEMR